MDTPRGMKEVNIFQVQQFHLDKDLLPTNPDAAVKDLWARFFKYLNNFSYYIKTIFAHNLGGFDGYFLYKGLLNYDPTKVETIIDQHNKFIIIKYNNIVFKDSYRIFPVSLNELCRIFDIKGINT